MRETRPTAKRGELTRRSLTVFCLLAVLAGGLAITSLTHDWLDSAPYHDHLFLGVPGHGWVQHTHAGAGRERPVLQWLVDQLPTSTTAPRVVLLRSLDGAPVELSSFALGVCVLALLGLVLPQVLVRLVLAADLRPVSWSHPPPLPPPRSRCSVLPAA